MTNEIERAVHDVLNIPEGQETRMSAAVANLIGMASETDEARISALEEVDRARAELERSRAEVAHLESYIAQHGGKAPDFEYTAPEGRRRRAREAMTPLGILSVLADTFRQPDTQTAPDILEATPTGSITTLPRRERRELEEQLVFDEPVVQTQFVPDFDAEQDTAKARLSNTHDDEDDFTPETSLRDAIEQERERTPNPLGDDFPRITDPAFLPTVHRTGFIPTVTPTDHETRGIDLPPMVPSLNDPIDLATNSIEIVAAPAASEPVRAIDIVETQESPLLPETLPKRRRWWQKKDAE